MRLAEFSVKNSLLVNLISVFILIAGFYTLFIYQIRREAFPEVSWDMVLTTTLYPGAAPEEVEKLITVPIEKELKGVDGIEEMQSASLENSSSILVKINQDVKDKKKVVADVKDAVDRAVTLPREAEEPMVVEITSGEMPVVEVALSGDLSEEELQVYAERLENILEDVPGVSSISRKGWRDREVWVEVDPEKMKDTYLSLEEVMSALGKRNMAIPAGKLRGREEYSIRTTGEFYTAEEIADVVIRANEVGNWLRIRDVAGVRFAFEDEDMINKSYGTRSISLTVIKRATGDAIKIVDQVKIDAETFIAQADSRLKVSFINDISYYIKRRLGVLKNNGIIGLFLVCATLMIFLNFRIAILTALGIPIAFCATLAVMGLIDLSVNLITMFGLIIVLGMLVDDGIIVAENCARYLEEGHSPREAAILGTEEVAKPVTSTIITTIAAFAPLLFMEGMMGKFIWGIPLVVMIALIASLFEALIILPCHFADFVKVKAKTFKSRKELPWFKKLVVFYTRILTGALRRRYLVIAGLIVLLIITFGVAKTRPFVLFGSEEGIEQFYVRAEAPVGTNLNLTNELIAQVEAKVAALPAGELEAYTTQVGSIGESFMFDEYGKSGSHVAQITVYVTPYSQRKRTVQEMIEYLRGEVKDIKGFDKLYFEKEQAGPPVGKAIAVRTRGEDFAVMDEISGKIAAFLQGIEGVHDVASDYEVGRGEIRVVVDEEAASRADLSVSEIASSIRYAFKGGVATTIKPVKAEEEIDVLVRLPEEYRTKKDTFEHILVPNKSGYLVPLNKIARIEEKTSVARIRRLDGKRVITVRADVDNQKMTSLKANQLLMKEFKDVNLKYPGYSLEFGGEQEENVKSMRSFIRAFGLAFFLIFMILAANFNSLIQPIVVMMAIPFGLIGVIWAFVFHGLPMSFFMMMGVIGLTGIVVNDSIVLVEFINGLRRKGIDRRQSIIEGGQLRLRPVLLTTITTALGLTPTAYGIGGGDPFLKPMALTIVWGIICATALTLVALPCIYAIIDDITLKVVGHATVRKQNNGKFA
ncbi:efflux RND transporter permease subunit [Candidatus Omnitrophota bacterium]